MKFQLSLFGYRMRKHREEGNRQPNMTKSNLISALAAKKNLSETMATEIINQIFNGFTDTLKKGDRIEIRGFGSLTVREYKAYTGRNPQNGKDVYVRPKKLPFFKVGKELKELVNCSKA